MNTPTVLAKPGDLTPGPTLALPKPPRVPTFTHDELRCTWEALAQYVENSEEIDPGEGHPREGGPPSAALTALEKLDAYFAGVEL